MKKTMLIVLVFLSAMASAFTTKLINPTGYGLDALGNVVSGPTNDPGCALNKMTNCWIFDSHGRKIVNVYDSPADINVASKLLKFN